jgi:hypothetical protein
MVFSAKLMPLGIPGGCAVLPNIFAPSKSAPAPLAGLTGAKDAVLAVKNLNFCFFHLLASN